MSNPRSPGPRDLVPTSVLPAKICQAHTSSGRPCKKSAIVGGFVCATHGGSAPQVRAAANRRLLALAPRAVQVMADLLEHAESEPVRLKAATELLDRGIGKAVDVTLDLTPEHSSGPSPLARAIAAAMEVRGLEPGDFDPEDPEVLEAEVLEDPEVLEPEPEE